MSTIRSAFAAAAYAIVSLAAPLSAHAADAHVVVVDVARLYNESAAGKYVQNQLKTIANNVQSELAPEEKNLSAEEKGFGFEGKTREQIAAAIKADKALQAKTNSYGQRLQNFLVKQDLRGRELQATEQKAFADVMMQAKPSIEEAMRARGATVVIEANSALVAAPDADITSDVIARFSKRVASVPVSKIDLTKAPR